jgi:hypothetical protein
LNAAGEIARKRGDIAGALRHLDEAEGLARDTAAWSLLAPVRLEQAKAYAAAHDLPLARAVAEEAHDLPLARAVAEEARDLYAQSGRDEHELVEKWLANLPAAD